MQPQTHNNIHKSHKSSIQIQKHTIRSKIYWARINSKKTQSINLSHTNNAQRQHKAYTMQTLSTFRKRHLQSGVKNSKKRTNTLNRQPQTT